MDLGPHAFYIAAAYAVTAVIVAALILRAVLDHRAQIRALSALSDRGVARRSDPGRKPPDLLRAAPPGLSGSSTSGKR